MRIRLLSRVAEHKAVRALAERVAQTPPRRLLGAYVALSAVDSLLAAKAPTSPLRWATKPLLMPALGAYLVAAADEGTDLRAPLVALAGGCVGDVALLTGNEALFLAGMGGFAVGHVAYLRSFVHAGAVPELLRRPWLPAAFAASALGVSAWLWHDLGDLRGPVLGYSALLASVGACAATLGPRPLSGGALFALSDAVIACEIAGARVLPRQDAAIMPTYTAAQLLLVSAWTHGPLRSTADAPRGATAVQAAEPA